MEFSRKIYSLPLSEAKSISVLDPLWLDFLIGSDTQT